MYESHFGLSRPPFTDSLNPADWCELPSRAAALRRCGYGLQHVGGPVLVFGPAGAGKSMIAARLAHTHRGQVVHLTFPLLTGAELLRYVGLELGVDLVDDRVEALSRLRNHLAMLAAEDRRPLWIIDDAQLVPDVARFEHIRMLLDLNAGGRPQVDLLLCGTAELVLRLPPALTDRLSARCLVSTLTEEEVALYMGERLTRAGGNARLFAPEAIRTLHLVADGLPRRINRLGDLALLITFGRGSRRVESDAVELAARDFGVNL